MDSNVLVFWSIVTIIIRILALIMLGYVAIVQYKEFRFKSTLQPLKRILFYIPITIAITNIPQMSLSWIRINNNVGSIGLTSLATVSNAVGIFLTAFLLLLVYTYKGSD
jgi:hypothetical protein